MDTVWPVYHRFARFTSYKASVNESVAEDIRDVFYFSTFSNSGTFLPHQHP